MAGTFAVLGDTHFVHEGAHFNALKLGWPGGVTSAGTPTITRPPYTGLAAMRQPS